MNWVNWDDRIDDGPWSRPVYSDAVSEKGLNRRERGQSKADSFDFKRQYRARSTCISCAFYQLNKSYDDINDGRIRT